MTALNIHNAVKLYPVAPLRVVAVGFKLLPSLTIARKCINFC